MTWLLVYENQPNAETGKKIVDMLQWIYTQGQTEAATLDYAPLPQSMIGDLQKRVMGQMPFRLDPRHHILSEAAVLDQLAIAPGDGKAGFGQHHFHIGQHGAEEGRLLI